MALFGKMAKPSGGMMDGMLDGMEDESPEGGPDMESPALEESEEAKLSVLEEIRQLMDSLDEKKLSEGMSLLSKKATPGIDDKPEEDDSDVGGSLPSKKNDEQKLRAISKG